MQPVPLPVVGAEHAPGLVDWLCRTTSVEVAARRPTIPSRRCADGEVAGGAGDPAPTTPSDSARPGPAPLELLVDASRQDGRSKVRRVRRAHRGLRRARSAPCACSCAASIPKLAQPVALDEVDLATPQQVAANLLNVIPMFVMMAAFIGGMYVATDSTAGERERGSLEPLLINPVDRRVARARASGSRPACSPAAASCSRCSAAGIALSRVPLEDLGLDMQLTADDGAAGSPRWCCRWRCSPPRCSSSIATFARSFREAQTYLSVLTLAPTLPGVLLAIHPVNTAAWMMLVPVLGQQALVLDVLRGEPVSGGLVRVGGCDVHRVRGRRRGPDRPPAGPREGDRRLGRVTPRRGRAEACGTPGRTRWHSPQRGPPPPPRPSWCGGSRPRRAPPARCRTGRARGRTRP